MGRHQGFTLIELVMVVVILGALAAIALPQFVNLTGDARKASIQTLEGAVRTSTSLVESLVAVRGIGSQDPNFIAGLTFVEMGGNNIRLWNGYPDRWWDGIGMTLSGAAAIPGGGYLSTAAVPYGTYTFYGYGSSAIPNGNAGWRLEDAPDPVNCSVAYSYNGSGTPEIIALSSGC